MRPFKCVREHEVVDALNRGHWPDACAPELRAHVAECRACSDLVLVTRTFQQARVEAAALPRVESAGALWWRAQLRRRNTAIERIGRPILGAWIFALAIAVVVGVGVLVWESRQGRSLATWFEALPGVLHLNALLPTGLAGQESLLWVLLPILATIALLSGVVVYMVSERH
jgi:hypothetical protein